MRVRRPRPLDYGAKLNWLGDQDSNLGEMIQSHLCYRYIIPQNRGHCHYKGCPAVWQAAAVIQRSSYPAVKVLWVRCPNGLAPSARGPRARPPRLNNYSRRRRTLGESGLGDRFVSRSIRKHCSTVGNQPIKPQMHKLFLRAPLVQPGMRMARNLKPNPASIVTVSWSRINLALSIL